MDSIPRFIECKNNPSKITYKHPLLEPILKVTYGCIVYQNRSLRSSAAWRASPWARRT